MILTPRLLKIAQMIEYKNVADIGTDHAKLPVYLVENEIAVNVIASDVATGPVQACKRTVAQCGMTKNVQIRQGDGLTTLHPYEVESVIIAGMGGDLISKILSDGADVAESVKEIILQPMTHIPQLRKFLNSNNYRIIDEVLISENNKIYTIIKVACGKNQYENDLDYLVSPFFIKNKDKLLPEYLLKLLNKYKNEINGMKNAADLNVEQLNENIKIIEKLEKLYEVAKDY